MGGHIGTTWHIRLNDCAPLLWVGLPRRGGDAACSQITLNDLVTLSANTASCGFMRAVYFLHFITCVRHREHCRTITSYLYLLSCSLKLNTILCDFWIYCLVCSLVVLHRRAKAICIMHKNLVKIGLLVFSYMSTHTNKHANIQTDRQTDSLSQYLAPFLGRNNH